MMNLMTGESSSECNLFELISAQPEFWNENFIADHRRVKKEIGHFVTRMHGAMMVVALELHVNHGAEAAIEEMSLLYKERYVKIIEAAKSYVEASNIPYTSLKANTNILIKSLGDMKQNKESYQKMSNTVHDEVYSPLSRMGHHRHGI